MRDYETEVHDDGTALRNYRTALRDYRREMANNGTEMTNLNCIWFLKATIQFNSLIKSVHVDQQGRIHL